MPPLKDNIISIKRLSSDTEYFNNVFKKTEKIVSVIFYILSHTNNSKDNEIQISLIKDKALLTHAESLSTLRLQSHEISEGLLSFQYAMVGLESTLHISEASGVISRDIAHLLFEQLSSVQRYVNNHYLSDQGYDFGALAQVESSKSRPTSLPKRSTPMTPRRGKVNIPSGDISSDAYMVYSQLGDRTARIKTVLEAKPQATIKDIAEIITDVSEKTIQRELNSLIEKGQVIREGERRWSKYSTAK
jgi:DNA-binding transcriptional ArsR family regulator